MKKSRVSWPSESMLCQVKMFRKEDCPAQVAPGFEEAEYAAKRSRIKWKRPPMFILNEALRVVSGGASTETSSENLRISCVLEAFYPHRSAIPNGPCVSRAVVAESYDDSTTPNIRLTPIDDDEPEEPSINATELGPDLSLAVSAALSALMKANEQGSLVDADLLIKLLSDPNVVTILMNQMASEAANNNLNSRITEPMLAPQHVTSLAMDRIPPPVPVSSATTPPFPKPTQPVSSALSVSLQKPAPVYQICPLPRIDNPYSTASVDAVSVSEQKTTLQSQSLNVPTWNTNKEPESLMSINRDDQVVSAKPVKTLEYYKNLIREHGRVVEPTNETDRYKARGDNVKAVKKAKFQKACMFFGRGRGCKLGESCLYLHDSSKRPRLEVPDKFPRVKRPKFGT